MRDIFISYSKQDQSEARLLAAFLEAQGYDMGRDTTLLGGNQIRKVTMKVRIHARALSGGLSYLPTVDATYNFNLQTSCRGQLFVEIRSG